VITTKPIKKVPKSQSSAATEDSEPDSDAQRLIKRRASTKKPAIVISDDEDENVTSEYEAEDDELRDNREKISLKKAAQKIRSKPKPPPSSASSDYEESEAGTPSEDEIDYPSPSDDERSNRKKPSKPLPKPRKKSKSTGSQTASSKDETDRDDMDIDESPPKTNGKATKRKATDDKPAAKKQKRREDTDPWKLESSAVKRDWTLMKAPPLEMFHFARVVVDEYTYLDGKAHALVTNLTAERHWVLSGTPPIHDFAALKTIAAFLDVHLGVDDDAEGQSAQIKKRRREQTGKFLSRTHQKNDLLIILMPSLTASEKFHSFREVHSLEWHAHRHEIGQAFLDRFVRQVRGPPTSTFRFLTLR